MENSFIIGIIVIVVFLFGISKILLRLIEVKEKENEIIERGLRLNPKYEKLKKSDQAYRRWIKSGIEAVDIEYKLEDAKKNNNIKKVKKYKERIEEIRKEGDAAFNSYLDPYK